MIKGLIDIHIGYRDRPTELALLLQSLWHQTYKNFRIFISDDCSGSPIENYHFLMCMINKMNDSGHFVTYSRNDFNLGVSKNRQKMIDMSMKEGKAEYVARLDDDVMVAPDYLEELLAVIDQGFDLASGVTPFIGQPSFKRQSKFIQPIGNKVILNNKGEFLFNGDDFGMEYIDEAIIPIHHFRSCALMKKEIFDKVSYESRLTKHGFREEQIFSFKCMIHGFKMGVNTKAVAWHLLTPSGGERFADSNELVRINENVLIEFTKDLYEKHGDFIGAYNKLLGINYKTTPEDLLKPANCMIR